MPLVAELKRRNVLRVAAAYLVVGWLLTEVLTTILPTLGAPEWAARAVILIFVFGFIPAVIFSWFYELTPDGIKREEDVDRDDPQTSGARKKLDYVTVASVVALVIIIGLFSARQTGDENEIIPATVSDASVAVLPFVNMSNDKDNEYFSDGLTETLLHMLAQIPGLKVAARTSSFAFKDRNMSIQEIAAALDVAHVLEGSVQRAGDRVRITAQLIRASDGFHVWSSNFDRTLDDIFGIQDEIAEKVGSALSASLLGSPAATQFAGVHTTDSDAYDLYLQARKLRATFSYGGLTAAEDLLKGALLIDPDFLDAKTELASTYMQQLGTGLIDASDAYPQIIAMTDQVLAVRPDDSVASATKLFAETAIRTSEGDFEGFPDTVLALEEIVAASPDKMDPRILLVRAYTDLQQMEKAIPVLEEARKRDPFNPQIHYELGAAYLRVERFDKARASLEKALEIEPAQPNAYTNLGDLSLAAGDGVGYVTQFLKALQVDPKDHELPGILAVFLYQLGLIEEGDDLRDRVLTLAPTSEIAYRIELLRAIEIGDQEASIASARRAVEDDIDARRFAYAGAVRYLLRVAIRSGTVEQASAFIEENAPGIYDFEEQNVSAKYRMAQSVFFESWYATLPRDEFLRRLDTMQEIVESMGIDLTEQSYTYMSVLAMRGEIQKAIEVALDKVFSQSVAKNLGWRDTFSLGHYAEMVEDPRIQAAMRRWEEEEAVLRGQVQTYLADLQAAT